MQKDNEVILIDNVNVAGCECYSKETGLCNYELSCNLKSNCVFKVNTLKERLKEVEQKYNEVLKLAKENADSNECVIQELEKENENLKSLLDFEVQKAETYQQENEELKETAEGLLKIQYALTDSCNKYSKALEEIREIINEQCKQCYAIDGFAKPDDCGICEYKRLLDTINKVLESEVENE